MILVILSKVNKFLILNKIIQLNFIIRLRRCQHKSDGIIGLIWKRKNLEQIEDGFFGTFTLYLGEVNMSANCFLIGNWASEPPQARKKRGSRVSFSFFRDT